MNEIEYKTKLNNINFTKEDKVKISKAIKDINYKYLNNDALKEGMEEAFNYINSILLYDNLSFINFDNSYVQIPLDINIKIKNNEEIERIINLFIVNIDFLKKSQKILIKKLLKEFIMLKKERVFKYLYSGINNDSSLYYMIKLKTYQKIILSI